MSAADSSSVLTPSPQHSLHDLYSDHHGWLKGWLRRRLGCSEQAADLAHDTYLRLLVAGTLPQPAQSRSYLTQIAKGLVIDLFRRRRIETAYLDVLAERPEIEAPSAETQAMVIQALLEIDAVLQRIPTKARRAFLLCRLDGLSYREIAGRLGVSVSSVEKYIAQALVVCGEAMAGLRRECDCHTCEDRRIRHAQRGGLDGAVVVRYGDRHGSSRLCAVA